MLLREAPVVLVTGYRPDAQASVTCKRLQLLALMQGQQVGQVQISGDATALKRLLAYTSKFEKTFNVIEPLPRT